MTAISIRRFISTMSTNTFFGQFPTFHYNAEAPAAEEFKRLGQQRKWQPGSRRWKKEWNAYMNTEYDRLIGRRLTSLATWQQLCDKLGANERFTSINQCKKVGNIVFTGWKSAHIVSVARHSRMFM